jgi:hypothetical protein
VAGFWFFLDFGHFKPQNSRGNPRFKVLRKLDGTNARIAAVGFYRGMARSHRKER